MREINVLENKEIFELKKKCKVVQDKISKIVDKLPVGNISVVNVKEETKKEEKENDKSRALQN